MPDLVLNFKGSRRNKAFTQTPKVALQVTVPWFESCYPLIRHSPIHWNDLQRLTTGRDHVHHRRPISSASRELSAKAKHPNIGECLRSAHDLISCQLFRPGSPRHGAPASPPPPRKEELNWQKLTRMRLQVTLWTLCLKCTQSTADEEFAAA